MKKKLSQREIRSRLNGTWCLKCKSDKCVDEYHKRFYHTKKR